jgi:hypothetical protein
VFRGLWYGFGQSLLGSPEQGVAVPLSTVDLVPKVKTGKPVICGCFCYAAGPRRNEGSKKEF